MHVVADRKLGHMVQWQSQEPTKPRSLWWTTILQQWVESAQCQGGNTQTCAVRRTLLMSQWSWPLIFWIENMIYMKFCSSLSPTGWFWPLWRDPLKVLLTNVGHKSWMDGWITFKHSACCHCYPPYRGIQLLHAVHRSMKEMTKWSCKLSNAQISSDRGENTTVCKSVQSHVQACLLYLYSSSYH